MQDGSDETKEKGNAGTEGNDLSNWYPLFHNERRPPARRPKSSNFCAPAVVPLRPVCGEVVMAC